MKKYLFLFLFPTLCFAQHDSLRLKIKNLDALSKGKVEVAIKNIETGDALSFNGKVHAPMQSVFKFPIALVVLNRVDKELLTMQQPILLTKKEMDTNTWSPMSRKYIAKGDTAVSLEEMLYYMVTQSDNVACDKMIKLCGGPDSITEYIHKLGVAGINIKYNESEMHKNWSAQYADWCESIDMVHLIELFQQKKCLRETTTQTLIDWMQNNKTGDKRIRFLLPAGTTVANKTGTSNTQNGLTAATNDVGIITLLNGTHLAIAVFVTNSKADQATRERVIAEIAKAAYNEFSKH